MHRLLHILRASLRRFRRDEQGIAAVEMIVVMPVYLFCIISTFTFWDAYNVVNRAQKASYSVSDLITRKQDTVTEAYVTGMFNTMQYMMGPSLPVRTRITSLVYSGARERYEVLWSRSSVPTIPRLTTSTITSIRSSLPVMYDGDALIVVETTVEFTPILGRLETTMIGLDSGPMHNIIVTRPRFLPKICMQGVACG